MSNGEQQFPITGLKITPVPRLDQYGNPFQANLVTFFIGPHGPFPLMFPGGTIDPTVVMGAVQTFANNVLTLLQNISNFSATLP